MSKKRKKLDNQLSFNFDQKIEEYTNLKSELLNSHTTSPNQSYEEACIEIAATVKRMYRDAGLSREQLVDAINNYFGWKQGPEKSLSIHMLNHHLSKPVEYPMPAFLIFAIQRVTESLDLAHMFAEAEGGKAITESEIRQWALGKLDETILEMQRIKKELRTEARGQGSRVRKL